MGTTEYTVLYMYVGVVVLANRHEQFSYSVGATGVEGKPAVLIRKEIRCPQSAEVCLFLESTLFLLEERANGRVQGCICGRL